MNLNNIVSEAIKRTLNERVSSRVFHFLPIAAMANIAASDTIHFSASNRPSDEILSKGYPYYLSLSRTPSTSVGYVRMRKASDAAAWRYCIARIEFDGDKLNDIFKGGPVNYFNDELANTKKIKHDSIVYSIPSANGKNPLKINAKKMPRPEPSYKQGRPYASQIAANKMRPEIIRQTDRNQMHEYEDRIFSEYSGIEGVGEYIRRIDILIYLDSNNFANETKREALSQIGKVIKMYGDKVNIYTNEVAFNSMNIEDAISKKGFLTAMQQKRYTSTNKDIFLNAYSKELNADFKKGLSVTALKNIGKALYCASYVSSYYTGRDIDSLFNYYLSKIGLPYDKMMSEGIKKLLSDIEGYGNSAIRALTTTMLTPLENELYGDKRCYYDAIMALFSDILNEITYLTGNTKLNHNSCYLISVMVNVYNRKQAAI